MPIPNLMDDDRKSVSKMLLAQALDTGPAVWSQGMARALAGLLAGMEESSNRKELKDYVNNLPGLGASTPAPMAPPAPMGAPPSTPTSSDVPRPPAPIPAPMGGGLKTPAIANQDEMNFMDARVANKQELANALKRSPEDVDKSVRTIIGESAGEPMIGQQAVASTLLNRASAAGTTPGQEATKPGQYEPWMTAAGRARMFRPSEDSPEYGNAKQALFAASQVDPTGGANHFYSPGVQSALGREPPKWDNGTGQMVGSQKFFNLPYGNQQPQQTAQAPPPQQAPPGDINRPQAVIPADVAARIKRGMQSSNPAIFNDAMSEYRKYTDPGTWKPMEDKAGNIIGVNEKTGESKVLRQMGPEIAQQEAAKRTATETAEAQVKAKQALPGAETALAEAEKQVAALKTHPGRQWGLGSTAVLGNIPTSSDAYAFKVRHDQALGGAFLAAYESLKGGGAIANAEGVKATTAKARMDRSTSAKEYDEALDDFISAVRRGVGSMREQAGVKQEDSGGWQEFNGIRIRQKQ